MKVWNGEEWQTTREKWVPVQMMMILTDMATQQLTHFLLTDNGTTNSAQCSVGSKLQIYFTLRDHFFSTMTIS